jgi:hypothetical protein
MSDYEATAYLSLEKLKVSISPSNFKRKNTCSSFSSSKIKSGENSNAR